MKSRNMKRTFCIIAIGLTLLISGCKREEILPAEIKVEVESVSGSRASITVVPANLHAYYSYVLVGQNNENFNAPPTDICNEEIRRMEENYPYFETGSFTDVYCYRGSRRLTMRSLADDIDFKLIVFQINPNTHKLIGEPIVCAFHTKPVPHRDLHFQVDFVGDELHITPSNDSLTYFWSYDETEMIYDIYHAALNYLYMLAGMYQEYGFMDNYYDQGPCVWHLSLEDNITDGTEYTLVVVGCEEGEFTSDATIVKFRYHPGHIDVLEVIEGNEWQN